MGGAPDRILDLIVRGRNPATPAAGKVLFADAIPVRLRAKRIYTKIAFRYIQSTQGSAWLEINQAKP